MNIEFATQRIRDSSFARGSRGWECFDRVSASIDVGWNPRSEFFSNFAESSIMPPLLRYQIFLGYGVAFLAAWFYALQHVHSENFYQGIIIRWAPILAIVILGIYAAGSVVYGVAQTRDVPEAARELEVEVAEARKEMKKRGILQ